MTSPSSLHKPRSGGKKRSPKIPLATPAHGTTIIDPTTQTPKPAFPLVSFLWPAKGATSQWITLPLILMAVGLFRWAAGLWGYSGYRILPMHGDFEAQRHWMEITAHLPISQWYFYDLQWWGLDYPPLTAYHSWVLGKIGSFINPAWFALDTSRGLEDPLLKVYMRATVLVSEYLTYIPAIVLFVRRFSRIEGLHTWETSIALVAILMQPSTILIDHVHFQYNTVMLGFFVASISSLLASRYLWASVFFVGALGFKQMALYYAPAVFAYLLGCCVFPRVNVIRLLGIATITLLSFVILFAPLLLGSLYDKYREIEPAGAKHTPQALHKLLVSFPVIDTLIHGHPRWWDPTLVQLDQAIYRIFPFARGLFEDKVANIWCALNVIIKLKKHSIATLQRLSLLATLIAITPPCFLLFLRPKHDMLLPALASTAWGFFLCSFQVHEKSVLLPLLPMTLMLASRTGLTPPIRAWVGWANLLAVWTMFPLLKRVELRIPYAVLSLLWAYLLGIPPASLSVYLSPSSSSSSSAAASNAGEVRLPAKILQLSFYIAMLAWHIIEEFAVPPASKPDLWVIANVGIGAAGFCICYLWCLWQCVLASGLVSKASSGSNNPPKLKPKTL